MRTFDQNGWHVYEVGLKGASMNTTISRRSVAKTFAFESATTVDEYGTTPLDDACMRSTTCPTVANYFIEVNATIDGDAISILRDSGIHPMYG